jgi:hypothetical protein
MAKSPIEPETISAETAADYLEPAQQPQRTDEQKIADELLSLRLLAGYHIDKYGREQTDYLKRDSNEEKQASAALARCVRDSMKGLVGELLALAIDPYTASASPTMKPTRRVRFDSPARGKPSTWARDLAIVYFIKRRLHKKRKGADWEKQNPDWKSDEPAIAEASDYYGLERSRIWQIWTRRKQLRPSAK